MSKQKKPKLTAKEDLALDALLGRYRTGESLWTFEGRHEKTFRKLKEKGLVTYKDGIMGNTVRAMLTAQALNWYIDPEYTSPNEKRLNAARKRGKLYG